MPVSKEDREKSVRRPENSVVFNDFSDEYVVSNELDTGAPPAAAENAASAEAARCAEVRRKLQSKTQAEACNLAEAHRKGSCEEGQEDVYKEIQKVKKTVARLSSILFKITKGRPLEAKEPVQAPLSSPAKGTSALEDADLRKKVFVLEEDLKKANVTIGIQNTQIDIKQKKIDRLAEMVEILKESTYLCRKPEDGRRVQEASGEGEGQELMAQALSAKLHNALAISKTELSK
ncbi:uncharacterized protein NEMAJ01_1625 [Nematocida major]|uniref:uncharacterized protein n=1 Tax=Nematocida major TaxID=1912982 RepID=UPI0020074AB7|nr:uncharacterized protein NEMAJ01_1625 [Nematocida major]KAH9386729.1 hypothetical protein NEMAJ01_1625 [Nematocida major]